MNELIVARTDRVLHMYKFFLDDSDPGKKMIILIFS